MRRVVLRFLLVVCALSLALSTALTMPGAASAKGKEGKVEKGLAEQVASADPDDELSVLVVGNGAAVGKHGGKKKGDLDLVGAVSAKVKAKDVDDLAADDGVSFVAVDAPMAPTGGIDATKLSTLYPKIDGAPAAWAARFDGTGVGVAMIDSDVKDTGNLGGTVKVKVPGVDVSPDDTFGHGTLVAGALAGQSGDSRYVGIAPEAKIYSIINRADGIHSSDVIVALQWVFDNAHKNNIRVVNLSLQKTVPSSYQMNLLDLLSSGSGLLVSP